MFAGLSAADPKNANWLRELGKYHFKFGETVAALGDLDRAEALFSVSLGIAEQLVDTNPDSDDSWRDLVGALYVLIKFYEASKDQEKELKRMQKCFAVLDTMKSKGFN